MGAAMKYTFYPILMLITLLSTALSGQQPAGLSIETPEGPKPWTSLSFNQSDDKFQFVIVTDRTGGLRPGVFPDAVRKVNFAATRICDECWGFD